MMLLSTTANYKVLSQVLCWPVLADAVGMACCEMSDIKEMSYLPMAVKKY